MLRYLTLNTLFKIAVPRKQLKTERVKTLPRIMIEYIVCQCNVEDVNDPQTSSRYTTVLQGTQRKSVNCERHLRMQNPAEHSICQRNSQKGTN